MKHLLMAGCMIVFLVSCATTPKAPSRIDEHHRPVLSGMKIARGNIDITTAQLISTPAYKGCSIQLVNTSSAPIILDCLVRWYEKDGMEARKGRPAWRRIEFIPGKAVSLPSIAPVPWCTEFGLEIKEPIP